MDYNLIEHGFNAGDTVFHVMKATVRPDGSPEYEAYSDEWLTQQEWALEKAAQSIDHTAGVPTEALVTALKQLEGIRSVVSLATQALRESVVYRRSVDLLTRQEKDMRR